MSKKAAKVCKLQFPTGGARLGPTLASAGINMSQFCTAFSDATKERASGVAPATTTVYEDKSFDFVVKTTPVAMMIKKAAGTKKASGNQKETSRKITVDQLCEIAGYKMLDLNTNDAEAAMRTVAGTAKNVSAEVGGFE